MSLFLLDQSGLSLDRLHTFALVAGAGSIVQAAKGEPSQQSVMSRQIRELEAYFGCELTRRKGRGIEITEAGRELHRLIRLQFHALADFRHRATQTPLHLRLAAGNSVLEWLLFPRMNRIVAGFSNLTFEYQVRRSHEIVADLLNHSADIGFLRKSAIVAPLRFKPLLRIGYALFVPARWRGDEASTLLRKRPWALTGEGEFSRALATASRKIGLTLTPQHRCTTFTQAAHLVADGVAAAFLPDTAPVSRRVRRIEVPWLNSYARVLGMAWHPRNFEVRPWLSPLQTALEALLVAPHDPS